MTRMQSLRRRVAQTVQIPGVIESPRDLVVVVVGGLAVAIAIAVLVSPAAALYLLARHVGLGVLEAVVVTLGLLVLVVASEVGL